MNKVRLEDQPVLSSLDEECVLTVHTDIAGRERVCIADELKKSIQTFNMFKPYDIRPTMQKNYTGNVKILVDEFNSFHLSSSAQKTILIHQIHYPSTSVS